MGKLKNALIALTVPLPSIAFYLTFLHHYSSSDVSSLNPFWIWCSNHPILLANLLFTINVDFLFWVIGLAQNTNWIIDLYWTVIPVMLVHYYASHPFAQFNVWRSRVVILLTWVWSIRLTHSYFRRENWDLGAREDWRFSDMRKQYGKQWWWISFFAVYVSQQIFLIGICLPMYAIHQSEKPLNVYDFVATVVCAAGIVFAYFADTQLQEFIVRNKKLKELGEPTVTTLDKGLWWYSRHPNYFGEQLWWWGLVVFGWSLGYGWTFVGSLINSLCLAYVTVLVEQRMLKQVHRAEDYRRYMKTTSVCIPWFKISSGGRKDKNA